METDEAKEKTLLAATATATTTTTTSHLRALPDPPGDLERLFREHHEQIFRTAYRVTGTASDAEDVLQTVFLRLVRREGSYDFAPNAKAYLLRSAVNASLDLLRSRGRANSVALDDVMPSDLAERHELNPEAQHADRETRQIIQEAVSRLGETASEMFVLRYFEGYDNREIATMMDTSQMVVAVTLHRARTRMRKEIGQFLEKHHEA